jgi:hypothetical protein
MRRASWIDRESRFSALAARTSRVIDGSRFQKSIAHSRCSLEESERGPQ